ncbi:predicted protein [Chaetomium globosum CBS 148.51]|uniref:Uncharacterized protein n=1 Tax=Chaetomium globosum (strain ATCC 6205 / CBS 148.51 / DSM 1962 / NBRC 6347 / NRRL 1970) TaxID=306901 RepID=Q2GYK5_CHAGB|nr:uncharacterized protein CHGG_06949 [Chaetomium globosum CBS 148.51]EAQ85696.1 predicted protein [Chaetomium globosum CBS 148.51]
MTLGATSHSRRAGLMPCCSRWGECLVPASVSSSRAPLMERQPRKAPTELYAHAVNPQQRSLRPITGAREHKTRRNRPPDPTAATGSMPPSITAAGAPKWPDPQIGAVPREWGSRPADVQQPVGVAWTLLVVQMWKCFDRGVPDPETLTRFQRRHRTNQPQMRQAPGLGPVFVGRQLGCREPMAPGALQFNNSRHWIRTELNKNGSKMSSNLPRSTRLQGLNGLHQTISPSSHIQSPPGVAASCVTSIKVVGLARFEPSSTHSPRP